MDCKFLLEYKQNLLIFFSLVESDLKLNHIDESGESNEGIDLVDNNEGILYQAEV